MSDVYHEFQRLYQENKQYEEITAQKAVIYFNSLVHGTPEGAETHQPYQITETQDANNYKTMQYEIMLSNGETEIPIEVKADNKSRQTGDFFLKFQQYGKASGIATTRAKYYIFTDTVNYYMVSVFNLMQLLRAFKSEGMLQKRQTVNHKGWTTKGYIIKKELLQQFAVDVT